MQQMPVNTYLFVWNPLKWPWPALKEDSLQVKKGKKFQEEWTCVSHKKVNVGDRAFLSQVGADPRGIFASGFVSSEPFLSKSRKGKEVHKVRIDFDVLLDPRTEPILGMELLQIGKLAGQLWAPQASGISIRPSYAEELELLWEDFLLREKYE